MGNNTILVVDDNEMNMKLVKSILQLKDYKVVEAENAEIGIQLAREQQPNLILMDIQLPGMDGLSATRCIKEDPELRDIPVIAVTGFAMKADEKMALEAGCSDYMTKPIDMQTFLGTVAKHLENNHKESQSPGLR